MLTATGSQVHVNKTSLPSDADRGKRLLMFLDCEKELRNPRNAVRTHSGFNVCCNNRPRRRTFAIAITTGLTASFADLCSSLYFCQLTFSSDVITAVRFVGGF